MRPDIPNGAMPPWCWADAEDAERMWRAGKPVRVIAKRVRKTRNAVISKANRSGWGVHPSKRGWLA